MGKQRENAEALSWELEPSDTRVVLFALTLATQKVSQDDLRDDVRVLLSELALEADRKFGKDWLKRLHRERG